MSATNRVLYRASKGKVGGKIGKAPVGILTTVGRKTSAERAWPLIYLEVPDGWVVMASNGGRPNHPAWYLNLEAKPDVTFEIAGTTHNVRAETVGDPERGELWTRLTAMYKGYDGYTKKTDRVFPIVKLRRR